MKYWVTPSLFKADLIIERSIKKRGREERKKYVSVKFQYPFTWILLFYVILQERVGGRVATFRKGQYIADLGAMVLTGLGQLCFYFW